MLERAIDRIMGTRRRIERAGGSYPGLFDDDDFADLFGKLVDDMLDLDPYDEAAAAGVDAAPKPDDGGAIDPHAIAQAHVKMRRQYAERVPSRISHVVAQYANKLVDDVDPAEIADRIDEIRAKLQDKIAKQGSDVTRYAEPIWSAGHAGYGSQLGESGVLLVWVLDDGAEHCDDCPDLAATSPYTAANIPTWPAQGDTECLDRCRCSIQADADSWNDAFPDRS